MASISIALTSIPSESLPQLQYALAFVSQEVLGQALDERGEVLILNVSEGANLPDLEAKIAVLVERYRTTEFGLKSTVFFAQEGRVVENDAWSELLSRRWVTEVGDGHVILRGPAAEMADLINWRIERSFVREFGAEKEIYPATIKCETLDRCNHFTSFPEHVDFVAHLRSDVDVLRAFSEDCKADKWSSGLHEGRMGEHQYAISPSCCYHCYEGMEGWDIPAPGRTVTTTVTCHRYEGRNQRSLSRLRSFTMREVIWVGHPAFVLSSRKRADPIIIKWATDWELSCTYETANDMFFTDDYAIKASFQRQQEAKRELRMIIPQEGSNISVFSSNFHSSTFGKAFGITVEGRTAASACLGWGFERMVYGIFSQFGFDESSWPSGLREDLGAFRAQGAP